MTTTDQKRNIIIRHMTQSFWHLYFYHSLTWLVKTHRSAFIATWLTFFLIAIMITALPMQTDRVVVWIVAGYFLLWIFWIALAGIDKMIINTNLRRIYEMSADDCQEYLNDDLTEEEFREILSTI